LGVRYNTNFSTNLVGAPQKLWRPRKLYHTPRTLYQLTATEM